MTEKSLADRIERVHAVSGGPIGDADLPEGFLDPIEYLTDEEGNWDHERYARLLLEERGPAGPASVALKELEQVEATFDRLADLAAQGDEASREELARIAERAGAGDALDPEVLTSIRACLVVLGEATLEE